MNAWSVTLLSGAFTVGSLIFWSPVGIVVGVAVVGAGLMELRGRGLLLRNASGAREWMALSQVWLLMTVLIYAAHRLWVFDWNAPLSDMSMQETMQLTVLTGLHGELLGRFVAGVYGLIYGVVAVVTVVYQGGLALYYWLHAGGVHVSKQAQGESIV